MSGGCCGQSICDITKEQFVCQAREFLPDFGGKLKKDGNFFAIWDTIVECFYDEVVPDLCARQMEANPCKSEELFDAWLEEYAINVRCPLPNDDPDLLIQLQRALLCIQVDIANGGSFNQATIDPIAEILGITYNIKIPTYNINGLSACDVLLIPTGSSGRCNPNDGCMFIESFIMEVTCAPTDAHVLAFECVISDLVPCHKVWCLVDNTPKSECGSLECEPTILADCVDIDAELQALECDDEVLV